MNRRGDRAMQMARRILRWIFGIVISAALFFGLGEWIARQLDVVDRLNIFPRKLYVATNHPTLPYRLRPGFEMERPGFQVRVNEFGLRGPGITATPQPGWRRILVLGDSVIFGHFTEENETFPRFLEQELRRRGQPRTEVLNGGVPGYNTLAELTFLEEFGLKLAPHVVLLGVSLNDFDHAPVLTASGIMTADTRMRDEIPWLADHAEFYVLLRYLFAYGWGRHWFQRAQQAGQSRRADQADGSAALEQWVARKHQNFYAAPSGPGWERVQAALRGLRALERARGLDLTILIFPERYQVGTDQPNLNPQRAWLALCAEYELRCVDLWPAFAAAAAARSDPLFGDTQHPNPAGLAVAARAVADLLTQ